MKLELSELLKGNSTKIKNKVYFSTKEYVQQFIDEMNKFSPEFVCFAKPAEQLSVSNSKENMIYNKVCIQAVLPETYWSHDGFVESINLVYSLDARKPVYKISKTAYDPTTGINMIFGLDDIIVNELISGESFDLSGIQSLMEKTSDFSVKIDALKEKDFDKDLIFEKIGKYVDFCINKNIESDYGKVQLSANLPVDIYKKMYLNSESEFYIQEHKQPTLYDIHEMFNYIVYNDKEKDLLNRNEKTLLINEMISL